MTRGERLGKKWHFGIHMLWVRLDRELRVRHKDVPRNFSLWDRLFMLQRHV